MYLYIDESGDLSWPFKPGKEIFALAGLIIWTDETKDAVKKIVTDTIINFKKYLSENQKELFNKTGGRIKELRGSDRRHKKTKEIIVPGLNNYPELVEKFFYAIKEEADISVYVLYLNKKNLKMKFPFPSPNAMRAKSVGAHRPYNFVLQNLLRNICLPKNHRFLSVTIDSRACAAPTRGGK